MTSTTSQPQVGHFDGDNRAGIDSTLHRISAIRNRGGRVVGLTCRVGRAVPGAAALVRDLVLAGRSVLLLGRPGGCGDGGGRGGGGGEGRGGAGEGRWGGGKGRVGACGEECWVCLWGVGSL